MFAFVFFSKMSKLFAVVAWEGGGISVAPQSWIVGDFVYWPPKRFNVTKKIIKCGPPDMVKWSKLACVVYDNNIGILKNPAPGLNNMLMIIPFF